MSQVAYSVDAQVQMGSVLACMLHAKPAVYRSVVLNPLFPLAGESVLIPDDGNNNNNINIMIKT